MVYDFQQYQEPGTGTATKTLPKKKRPIDESQLLPLADGVLSNNLGVPVIVVGAKVLLSTCSAVTLDTQSDTLEFLQKEYAYKEAHFDYIQQHLRRICLSCIGWSYFF